MTIPGRPPRVAVLDPARYREHADALLRTHLLVKALVRGGAEVDWYVDRDDCLKDGTESVTIHRLLPSGLGAEAGRTAWDDVRSIDASVGSSINSLFDLTPAPNCSPATLVFAQPQSIAKSNERGFLASISRWDLWARAAWHDKRSQRAIRSFAL